MSQPESPIRVKTLDHVTLIVDDLEASRKFYCDLLGMQQVERPGFSFDGSWFQAGSTQIHLILHNDESGPAGEHSTELQKSTRNRHFAFEVEDAKAAARFFEENKVPVLSGPKERPDGAVQVFLTDPDGHVVELCSSPK